MLSCFRSSRVVDELVVFESSLKFLSHSELRRLCVALKERNKEELERVKRYAECSDTHSKTMQESKETVHNMYTQLEKRINGEIA